MVKGPKTVDTEQREQSCKHCKLESQFSKMCTSKAVSVHEIIVMKGRHFFHRESALREMDEEAFYDDLEMDDELFLFDDMTLQFGRTLESRHHHTLMSQFMKIVVQV